MSGKRSFYFTEHALDEIDADDLQIEDVMEIAEKGEIIEDYKNDKPYPSFLKLGWSSTKPIFPIHVVCALDNGNRIHVITAYKPDLNRWHKSYKTRKK